MATKIDPIKNFLTVLGDAGYTVKKQGKEWKCVCPAHDDKQSSLQVGAGNKGVVLHCHAGCRPDQIVSAIGLKMTDLFYDSTLNEVRSQLRGQEPGVLATYEYTDEKGNLLFEVVKKEGKKFVQRVPSPNGGWQYSLGGARRVPYHLKALVHARNEQIPIWIVEGEKDVETLERLGLVATCNPGGAGKWRAEYAEHFHGAHVIICPDNDSPGRAHAEMVTEMLKDTARTIRVLELPDLPEKGDVTDWVVVQSEALENSEMRATLDSMAAGLSPVAGSGPQTFSATDLMMQEFPDLVWAVPGIITEGVTFLVGRPKIGKSWFSYGISIGIAQGSNALNTIPVEGGSVLYLALEDTPRRLRSRMEMMLGTDGEVPARLHFANHWPRLNSGGLQQIEIWIQDHPDARMVIIDTWAKFKAHTSEESLYQADYSQVSMVKALSDRYTVPIVIVHHQRKASDEDPLNTVSGSTGITGAADSTVILSRQRGADDGFLYVTGRDVEENRYLLGFDGECGQWTFMGEAEEVEEQSNEDALVALLAKSGEAMGPKEIADNLNIPEGTAKWLTAKLAQEDKITRVARGKYTVGSGQTPGWSKGPQIPGQTSIEEAFGDLEDDLEDGLEEPF